MELLALLTHRKEYVRAKAREILLRLGDKAPPVLAETLEKNTEWQFRRRIVEQVGKLGKDAASFVPTVASLLDDQSLELQIVVASFLKDLQDVPGVIPSEVQKRVQDILKNSLEYHIPPSYWSNTGHDFDDMTYVDVKRHDQFNRILRDTYFAKSTQDRPCPKGVHTKTKGGC